MAQWGSARAGRLLAAVASAVLFSVTMESVPLSAAPLSPIPRGDIAISLNPVATGMSAPLYGFAPPGDTSRLFVLEQNGLVRVMQNGSMLPAPALDIQARVSPPLNPANANDERG